MITIYNLKRISTGEEFEVTMSWDDLQETLKKMAIYIRC